MLAPEIGLTVSLSPRTYARLDADRLEALGVPLAVIERAIDRALGDMISGSGLLSRVMIRHTIAALTVTR